MKRIAEIMLHEGSDLAQVELVFVPEGATLPPSPCVWSASVNAKVATAETVADVAESLDAGEKRGQNQ